MLQMMFDKDFDQVNVDLSYILTIDDIPFDIKEFISNTSNKRVFFETKTQQFYCSKCLQKIDSNGYCSHCEIEHGIHKIEDIDVVEVYEISNTHKHLLNYDVEYLFFYIEDNNIFLYDVIDNVSYNNPFYARPYRSSKLVIDTSKSYLILKDGLIKLDNKEYISFKDMDHIIEQLDDFFDMTSLCEKLFFNNIEAYLYTDNLKELKNGIYKYTRLWEIGEYLKEERYFTIPQLTLYPLYYKQFEYLINYKLYNLALNVPFLFKDGRNFKEIFGVDKKYLNFMVQNDINEMEFNLFKKTLIDDIDILRYFSHYYWLLDDDLFKTIKIDLRKLKDYLEKNSLKDNMIDYFDYIRMGIELGIDMERKEVLYPQDLRVAHDDLYNQIEVIDNQEINNKIEEIANLLSINNYEDDNYVIYPVSSIEMLVDESRQQKNCVRVYAERIAEGKCQIYFMRRKRDINKSFVTIEVIDNKMVQARIKYNKVPDDDINKILAKWEKTLVTVIIQF